MRLINGYRDRRRALACGPSASHAWNGRGSERLGVSRCRRSHLYFTDEVANWTPLQIMNVQAMRDLIKYQAFKTKL